MSSAPRTTTTRPMTARNTLYPLSPRSSRMKMTNTPLWRGSLGASFLFMRGSLKHMLPDMLRRAARVDHIHEQPRSRVITIEEVPEANTNIFVIRTMGPKMTPPKRLLQRYAEVKSTLLFYIYTYNTSGLHSKASSPLR